MSKATVVKEDYKYGFHDDIASVFKSEKGLTKKLIEAMSAMKKEPQWMLDIHQGTLLFGKDYRLYYVLFIGLGLLTLLVTGVRMLRLFRARKPAA